MTNRRKNKWTVTLQGEDGQTQEVVFAAHWERNREGINEIVGISAAIQAWWESGKATRFQPLAVR